MSVFRPRNRLVNFRLSDEEFERLRQSCGNHDCRSISDFARQAVMDKIARGPEAEPERLRSLDFKVAELEGRVAQLLNLVQATGPSNAPAYTAAGAYSVATVEHADA
ncbi:MAG: hypothetical protein U0Q16_37290 [Bryobacteraceae bacterium]